MTPDTLGSGYLPNTPSDRSGLIVIFAATGVCWSLSVLVARLSGSALRRNDFGLGNWLIVTLTCIGISCSTAIFVGVKQGLGRSKELRITSNDSSIAQALYAADILYVLTLGLSKLTALHLITALNPDRRHKQICTITAVFTAVWTFAGTLAIALRCNPATPAMDLTVTQCPSLISRWASVGALGLLIELVIFSIAASMIWNLQMPRDKKVAAMLIFSVRIPVAVPVALRQHYLNTAMRSDDYFLAAASAIIAMQCALHYSIMSSSFFYLKPFLAAFDSNLGASTKLDTVVATRSSERRKGSAVSTSERRKGSAISLGPRHAAAIQAATQSQAERERAMWARDQETSDSKAPIIMKTQSYQVEYEG